MERKISYIKPDKTGYMDLTWVKKIITPIGLSTLCAAITFVIFSLPLNTNVKYIKSEEGYGRWNCWKTQCGKIHVF